MNRAFVADTVALILFFTTTGVINERLVAGMAWEQVLHARLLGAVLMVPVGRPYGLWRDWLMRRARKRGETAGNQAGAALFRMRSGSGATGLPSGMASLSPR